MAEDKRKGGAADRYKRRARGSLLRKEAWHLKRAEVGLIKRFGNDRQTLDAEAEKLKRK